MFLFRFDLRFENCTFQSILIQNVWIWIIIIEVRFIILGLYLLRLSLASNSTTANIKNSFKKIQTDKKHQYGKIDFTFLFPEQIGFYFIFDGVQDVSNVLKNRLYNRKWKRGKEVKEIFVWFNREIFLHG